MERDLPVSAWPEWKIVEKIGEGSFGKVYKAERSERGQSFYSAIKIINIPSNQSELNSVRSETGDDDRSVRAYFRNLVDECTQEISTMEYFRGNSYVVSVEDFKVMEYLDAIGWEISIRMEYLTSFMDYCAEKQLTEKEVIQLGLDLSKALQYCRKLNIIHRDIKPENIFVSRFGDFKLGDFGIARELERTMSSLSKKGTYSYMAPEMYKGEKYDSRVDIYSLGIVLYKLMNRNRLPFMNLEKQFITYRDKENALTRRMSGEELKPPADAGKLFSNIILKACAYDPRKRYQTPEEFYEDLDDLQHGRIKEGTENSPAESAPVQPEPQAAANPAVKPAGQPEQTPAREPVRRSSDKKEEQNVLNLKTPQNRQSYTSLSRSAALRKRRRKKRVRRLMIVTAAVAVGLALVITGGAYLRRTLQNPERDPSNNVVDILGDENYSTSEDTQQALAETLETIRERATTITDNLSTYSWIGTEGSELKYLDNDTQQIMKVLVYPAESEDDVYEEYFYWNEQMFFAYIWYDETKELYYYNDDGDLIRWIDEDGNVHDNETDNPEYEERAEKYWEKAEEALK